MIEDLQDELPPSMKKPRKKRTASSTVLLVFAFLIWIAYAFIIISFSLPDMEIAVESSGIRQIIASIDEITENAQSTTVSVCYLVPGPDSSLSEAYLSQKVIRTNRTVYHDSLEALLDGPDQEALKKGAISLVSKGTKLLGVTVSDDVAFVDLSAQFITSGSGWGQDGLELARSQIEGTLKAADSSIRKVMILIDGEEL